MVVKVRKMRATLKNKLNFVKEERRHEWYKLLDKEGKVIAQTLISHGASGKDIPNSVLAKIARQIHLTQEELAEAVSCPLSHEDYHKILKEKDPKVNL